MTAKNNNTTVAIIEDDSIVSGMLTMTINGTPGFQCVGSFNNAEDAITAIDSLKPEIVLSDINLPGENGFQTIKEICRKSPLTQCLVLTVFEDTNQLFEALKAGAVGFLLKSYPPPKIRKSLSDTLKNGSPMSATIARKVMKSFQSTKIKGNQGFKETLTSTENELLSLFAEGFNYKEIENKLLINRDMVNSHIRKIYRKMQFNHKNEPVVNHLSKFD